MLQAAPPTPKIIEDKAPLAYYGPFTRKESAMFESNHKIYIKKSGKKVNMALSKIEYKKALVIVVVTITSSENHCYTEI